VGFNAIADNTGLSSFVQQLLPLKYAKSREIFRKFEQFKVIQSHQSWFRYFESAYATYTISQ